MNSIGSAPRKPKDALAVTGMYSWNLFTLLLAQGEQRSLRWDQSERLCGIGEARVHAGKKPAHHL